MSDKKETVVRINKSQLDSLSSKKLFYYIDTVQDEDNEKKVIFGLVNNLNGKNKIKEFDSFKNLEKEVKKIINK